MNAFEFVLLALMLISAFFGLALLATAIVMKVIWGRKLGCGGKK